MFIHTLRNARTCQRDSSK